MQQKEIDRINELARTAKQRTLSSAEKAEQARLRAQYLMEYRQNLRNILDHTLVMDSDGTKHPLRKKAQTVEELTVVQVKTEHEEA